MIRRSFFQTLAAALLPQPVIAMVKAVQPGCEPPARAMCSPASILDPEWLQEWREIPKLENLAVLYDSADGDMRGGPRFVMTHWETYLAVPAAFSASANQP